ncbi:hypothetical protein [Chromobacterium amazonense]|uniref:hypothetical protein n=1 Tax=Chromobacterium amazonense TaxID=1382803 RepID=UPI00166FC96E|nr:hypothetical protein [Chromobacterium amazonense]
MENKLTDAAGSLTNPFGESYVFDIATYEPGYGKSALMSKMTSEFLETLGKPSKRWQNK